MTKERTEQILKAAATSPEAKLALKELFPDVFKEDKYFDLSGFQTQTIGGLYFAKRASGNFYQKALYLTPFANWELVTDDEGIQCLVPTKK